MLDCQLLKTFDELLLVSGFLSVSLFYSENGDEPRFFLSCDSLPSNDRPSHQGARHHLRRFSKAEQRSQTDVTKPTVEIVEKASKKPHPPQSLQGVHDSRCQPKNNG